jgi:hypothetical protein
MLYWLRNYPHVLEIVYEFILWLLRPFKRALKPESWSEKLIIFAEQVGKGMVFGCQMCGQCILHSTGMTCPMTCPKNLRNGPCGGVRLNGHCEVKPEMRCIWVEAYERSLRMSIYGQELIVIQPPVNHQLQGSSSWINMLYGLDSNFPMGWKNTSDVPLPHKKSTWEKPRNEA